MDLFYILLYTLCIFTSLACAVFLFRAAVQRRSRLLFWSALCFVGLTISNVILFLDIVIFPTIDLRPVRLIASLGGMLFLLYAFIWEVE